MSDETSTLQDVVSNYVAGANPSEVVPDLAPPVVEPVVDPVVPVAADGIEEKIDAMRVEFASEREGYKATIAQQGANIEQLNSLVGGAFNAARTPEPEPEVSFTEEDLRTDPVGTLNRVTEANTRRALIEYDRSNSAVLRQVVERGFKGEVAGLASRKFFAQAKPEIEKMFAAKPELKMQAGAAEMAYDLMVGQNYEKWEKELVGTAPAVPPVIPPPPVPAGKVGSGGGAPPVETKPAVELTQAQTRLKAKFAAMGMPLSDEDLVGD